MSPTCMYHRIVGLCLRNTEHDSNGMRVDVPFLVDPANWTAYEVDHQNWNTLDCRTTNLVPKEITRHRKDGRDGWHRKALTHAAKVKALRVVLRKRPARAPLRRPAGAFWSS